MATSSVKKRNYLTLKQKVEVITTVQNNPGINTRTLENMFNCGKTQIGKILKQKELALYESNASKTRAHTNRTSRPSEYEEINQSLYTWYTMACSKNIFPMSPQLAEKA